VGAIYTHGIRGMRTMSDNDVNREEESSQSFEEADLYSQLQTALQAREFGRRLREGKDPVFRFW